MCYKTLGVTMVIYKYEGDTYDYPFIMEHRVLQRTSWSSRIVVWYLYLN
jgi:hypothetical protein